MNNFDSDNLSISLNSAKPKTRRNLNRPAASRSRRRRLQCETLEARRVLTAYIVTTVDDTVAADTQLSLREALQAANTNLAVNEAAAGEDGATTVDTITFAAGLSSDIISLAGINGQLEISDAVAISLGDAPAITINAGGNSRVLEVTGGAPSSLSGLTLTGGNADRGGAVFVNSGLVFSLDTVNITGNVATGPAVTDGGGGVFNEGGSITIANSTIGNNQATGTSGSGGGIFSTAGDVTITATNIQFNEANRAGGGIELIEGTASLTSVNLLNNNVDLATANPGNGGGVHITGAANLTIDGGSIFGNLAGREGGGLWNSTGTLTIQNGTLIQGNEAGGDAADDGGGGIFNNGGTLVIDGSATPVQVINNVAFGILGSGGGVFNATGGTATINDAIITGNEANRAGGGIEATAGSTTTLTNVNLDDNTAGPAGSALPGNGGGLHITGAGDATITGGTVNDNVAASEGGGLWNGAGTLTVDGTSIVGNRAAGSGADQGGGGIFNAGGTVDVSNATISDNLASGATVVTLEGAQENPPVTTTATGTAAFQFNALTGTFDLDLFVTGLELVDTTADPELTAAHIHVGSAGANGPVILNLLDTEAFVAEDGGLRLRLSDVALPAANIADLSSGDLYFNVHSSVNAGGEIRGQLVLPTTMGSGGGVLNDGGVVTLTDTTISGNVASRAGGGIEATAGSTTTLSGVNLGGNVAGPEGFVTPGNGGGLHITGAGNASITGGTVNNNVAAREGGGLWNGSGMMIVDGTTISGNIASGAAADDGGAGIFNNGGTLDITGVTISNNLADGASGSGGGLLSIGGAVTVTNSTFDNNAANRAGGAIEIAGGTLTMGGTDLTDNDVDGTAGTAAPGNGGALHISGFAEVTLNGGTVSGNAAANEGGGLWNSNLGILTVNGTVIQNNTAVVGGGVFTQGGGIGQTASQAVRLTMTNLAPDAGASDSGLFLTPVFTGFHDGTFDVFNVGEAASAELERVAEDGNNGPIQAAFDAAQTNGVATSLPGGPFAPGATTSSVFILNPTDNRYYSYASMVIPSNDAFIGNDDAQAFELFDADGNVVPIDFTVPGSAVWDAGTEVNNEINAAFFDQMAADAGTTETELIAAHTGFLGSVGNPSGTPVILGGTQSVGPLRTFGTTNADFTTAGYNLLQVSIVAAGSGTTLADATITGNTATGDGAQQGGGGVFHTEGELSISGGSITNNFASGTAGSGGGILNLGGTLMVSGTAITGNIANRAGGGIEATAGSTTTLTNFTLDGNTAGPAGSAAPGNGGGLHISGDGNATITGGSVSDNTAASEGGGLWNGVGTMTVDGTALLGNRAAGSAADQGGGALFNAGGTLEISNATISDNLASGGAVVSLEGGQEVPAVTTTATGTAAFQFNALTGTFDLDLFVTGLELVDTTAAPELAAAHIHVGAVGENGPVILNLLDSESFVAEDGGLRLRLSDVALPAANIADLSSGNLYFNVHSNDNPGGEVRGQLVLPTTMGSGGGVLNDGGILTVTDTTISGNAASRAGGGIEATAGSTTTLSNVNLDNNVAGPNGFATPGNGGGLHISGDGNATLTGGTVNDNFAAREGGGLWNNSGTLTVDGTSLLRNAASGDAADDGGGAIFNNGGTLTVTAAAIDMNVADGTSGSGGGILNLGGTLDVTNSTITGNVANRAGGGIESTAGSVTNLTDVNLDDNTAGPAGSAAPGNGGGLHITGAGDASITGGSVDDNSAASEGGGLWNGAGTLLVDGTSIMGNRAAGSGADQGGGGIFNAGGTVNVSNTTITDNLASGATVVTLEGGQENPPVTTSVTGSAAFQFNATTGTFDLDLFVSGLELVDTTVAPELMAAHIHVGAVGENGPVILNLLDTESFLAEDGGLRLRLSDVALPAANVADLSSGNLYFNVHSNVNASGEVRGQLVLPTTMGSGGGVLNDGGILTVTDTSISGNAASRAGGGIEATAGSTTILSGVSLDSNVAGPAGLATPGNGGGLHITGAGNATITGGTVNNNAAGREGGGLWNGSGTMAIVGTTITGNIASGAAADDGGGGLFNNGGTLTIDATTISGNVADGAAGSGGGLLTIGGTVTVTNSTFGNNAANRAGGAIEIAGGALSLTVTDLTNNDVDGTAGVAAPGNGGALHVSGFAEVDITGGTVSGNTAAAQGGGLWNSNVGILTINGTTIEDNTAVVGGGIYTQGGGGQAVRLTMTNVAPDGGPTDSGLFLTPVFTAFHDGNFDLFNAGEAASAELERVAEDGNNAAIASAFTAAQASGVAASLPGGPFAPGATASSVFILDPTDNRFYSYASMVIPSNDAFIGNDDAQMFELFDADGNLQAINFIVPGSAVWDAGTEDNDEVDAAFFDQTVADTGMPDTGTGTVGLHQGFLGSVGTPGGTPIILGGTQSVGPGRTFGTVNADFTVAGYNLLQVNIEAVGSGTTLTGVTINANTATGDDAAQGGGGIFHSDGELTITGGAITGNMATGAAGSGGGIFNGDTINVMGTEISGNVANRAGGGIEAVAGSTTNLTSVQLKGNTAGPSGAANPGNGGGFHISGDGNAMITDGSVINNMAAREGGGLWNGSGTMTVTGSMISGNTAAGDAGDDGGGGLFNNGGTLSVTGVTITANAATGASGSGGGILNLGGTVTVTGTAITANTANRAGGGIEATTDSTTTLVGVNLDGNTAGPDGSAAPGNGGGLHISGAGTATITGGTVNHNVAAKEGGGLWNGSGSMTIDGTTISGNTASGADADDGGGGIFNNGGTLQVSQSLITRNDATGAAGSGGGVFNLDGSVAIVDSQITRNTANRAGGGIEDNSGTSFTLDSVLLSNNDAGSSPGNGGGLHITGDGNVVVADSLVSDNSAGNEGGGLWNSAAGTLTVTGSTIARNAAPDGGGVFADGDAGNLSLTNSTVANNFATVSGGGIASEGGTVLLNSATVAYNTAPAGGGLAVSGGTIGLFHSLIASNAGLSGADILGNVDSSGYNLISDTSDANINGLGSFDVADVNAKIGVLADNGGPTPTIALLPGSPALSVGTTATGSTDQRGVDRPQGNGVDLGAFESDLDAGPNFAITALASEANEGDPGSAGTTLTFTLTRTGNTVGSASVNYAVVGVGDNPTSVSDFEGVALPNGFITFSDGVESSVVNIFITPDMEVEEDETFMITLSNASDFGTISVPSAMGTILNDDMVIPPPAPSLSIAASDGVEFEGDATSPIFTFTVTRSGDPTGPLQVDYVVAGSGANAADAQDFVTGAPLSGTVNFGDGETSREIQVLVNADTDVELDETFTVTLSNPSPQVALDTATAIGTILNDDLPDSDPPITLTSSDGAEFEGDSGTSTFTFTVTRSAANSAAASLPYSVIGIGATPANAADFVGGALPSGTVDFANGELSKDILVSVAGDTEVEPDESFRLSLNVGSGVSPLTADAVITNDDLSPANSSSFAVSPNAADMAEGNGGTTAFTFTVTRSGDLATAASVDYSIAGSTANAASASDFGGTLPSGVVTFASNESSQVITVNVSGDTLPEADESFVVTLANPSDDNTISAATASGVIRNDDTSVIVQSRIIAPTTVARAHLIPASTIPTAIIFRVAEATTITAVPIGTVSFTESVRIYDPNLQEISSYINGVATANVTTLGFHAVVFEANSEERLYVISSSAGRDALVGPAPSNILQPTDTNGDSNTTPADALNVLNALANQAAANQAAQGESALLQSLAEAQFYVDVNRDGNITPSDALEVLNKLANQASASQSAASGEFVSSDFIRSQDIDATDEVLASDVSTLSQSQSDAVMAFDSPETESSTEASRVDQVLAEAKETAGDLSDEDLELLMA